MTSVQEATRDVEEARKELRRKLDAISERASLSHLATEASDYFNMGDGREFAHNLSSQAKANPMAALMVGLGVGWMMIAQRNWSAGDLHLQGTAEDVRRTAAEGGNRAREALSSTAHEASARGRHISQSIAESFERQPLLYGVAAFALGSALSALIAPTEAEEKRLGEVGEEVRDKAASFAREGAERAEAAASAAYEAGKSELEQSEFGRERPKPGKRQPEQSSHD